MFPAWGYLALVLLSTRSIAASLDEDASPLEGGFPLGKGEASSCDIYLAPSPIGGWGVYAGRDFDEHEVVELAPRFLPQKNDVLGLNVLDDYHYGFIWHSDHPKDTTFGVVVFGMTMFYNHGAGDQHNVQFTDFGRDPGREPHEVLMSQVTGFAAKRKIRRGEELLSSYGETDLWFVDRGLDMLVPSTEAPKVPPVAMLEQREQQYCSKSYAGVGQSTWVHRVLPTLEKTGSLPPALDHNQRLPLQDHPTAVAKVKVQAGQILEMAPALVLPLEQVQNSPLAPMSIFWDDWDENSQESIYKLRELGAFRMKAHDKETGRMSYDVMEFYNDAVVLPVAGNIGLVRKVGRDDDAKSNCRIELVSSSDDQVSGDVGSAGLVLKLIATKDIQAGEELMLNLPESSSWEAKISLLQHLAMTGQPIPKFLADPYNFDVHTVQDSEWEDEL